MVLDESLFDEAMYTHISSNPYDLNIMTGKLDGETGRDWKYVKSFKFKDDAIERANRMIANGDAYVAQVYSWLDEDHGEIYFKKADDGKVIDKSVQKVDCKTHGPELRTRTDKTIIKPIREATETKKCVICGCDIQGYGNNAQPVKDGICCDDCNLAVVIPARIKAIHDTKKEKIEEDASNEIIPTGEKDALGFDTYKYKYYTIVHFPLNYEFDGEQGHMESYLIQSPVKLSNSGYHLPLRAENEQGDEINFTTLDEVKAWIDKYDGKFKLQVKYGDEIHAVIKDEFKQIEESLTEDVAVVSLTNEQANENNGLSTILNTLIKDEFDAIQGYNDAIVNFETEGRSDLVQVLKDIVNEENLHVGQLEVLLEQVNGAANSIDQGKAEAETQLATEGGEIVEEDPEEGMHY